MGLRILVTFGDLGQDCSFQKVECIFIRLLVIYGALVITQTQCWAPPHPEEHTGPEICTRHFVPPSALPCTGAHRSKSVLLYHHSSFSCLPFISQHFIFQNSSVLGCYYYFRVVKGT